VPGWLGAPLDAQAAATPLGGAYPPQFVRLGMAQPARRRRFPAVIPLLRHRPPDHGRGRPRSARRRSAALLLLRLLPHACRIAAGPRGRRHRRAARCSPPFEALADAGLLSAGATDRAGLREILTEAEKWLRPVRAPVRGGAGAIAMLLVVIATCPS
jgi:hypothetical protein